MNELYIDGKRVDVGYGDSISLQYRSNLLSDIDKITSSNSLTIKLPKTPNNDYIVNFADTPAGSGIARGWHNAVYTRNGIQIIHGKAALISASRDGYEISLVWGVIDWLQGWLDNDKTLRDLPIPITTSLAINEISSFTKVKGAYVGVYYYRNGGESYVFPSVQVGYLFRLILTLASGGAVDTSGIDITELDDYYITLTDDIVKAMTESGGNPLQRFALKDYLPEISQLDFVKSVCHLMGWYFEVAQEGALRIVSFDILRDRSSALDWSNKLVSAGDIPDAIEFNYNGYSRRNWMRYAEDANVTLNADGYISVDDETLKLDKDLFKIIFAPTDNGNYIRQYETTVNDSGEASTSFIKLKPRILKLREDGPLDETGTEIPELWFGSDMYFANVIASRYSYYQDIVRLPRVITAQFNLSDADLIGIDYTKPVYIAQYGCYCAVIEIKNLENYSEAKLLII